MKQYNNITIKQLSSWIPKHLGWLIVIILLGIHLAIINSYGFTWDFHFHFFGGGKLLGYEWWQLEPRNLPYVEPDPRQAWSLPYGPLMSIPPVASYLLFHKNLGWLPADSAYHLPIILWGLAGIGILYAFMREAFNLRIAVLSSLFLVLSPRFFGDLHNNMKDVPNATVFALNMWMLWRLARYRRFKDLLLAVAAFAVAFNVKVNSIFIPIIFAAWSLLMKIINSRHEIRSTKQIQNSNVLNSKLFGIWNFRYLNLFRISIFEFRILGYFLLAPIAAFLLWWFFWPDPVGQLKHAWLTFGVGTNNIEVLLNGNWYCSGKNVPWYYPYWYLTITTPIPILLFFVVGVFTSFKSEARSTKSETNLKRFEFSKFQTLNIVSNFDIRISNLLLLLWLVVPLTRYLVPKIGVIDGIRHFEEVLFPLSALAALGLDRCIVFFNNVTMKQCSNVWKKMVVVLIVMGLLGSLVWNIASYHPYQITYFNELVGGVKGAFGKYDLDYWGTSQKAAVQWVNENAPPNAKVHIVMAAAVAGQYLRPDLIANLNKYGYDDSDFVILLNRQSFFYRFFYAYEYLLHHRPTKMIEVRGTPLVWIFDNRTNNRTPRQTPWWNDEDPCIIKYWRGEKLYR